MEPEMTEMNVTSAQYLKDYTDTISCIEATIGGELMYVPIAKETDIMMKSCVKLQQEL